MQRGIGLISVVLTGKDGPLRPLTICLVRCVAARETGLSLRQRNQEPGEFTQCGPSGHSLVAVKLLAGLDIRKFHHARREVA